MALTDCPECGGRVSDSAVGCPHCGFPLAESLPASPIEVGDQGGKLDQSVTQHDIEVSPTQRAAWKLGVLGLVFGIAGYAVAHLLLARAAAGEPLDEYYVPWALYLPLGVGLGLLLSPFLVTAIGSRLVSRLRNRQWFTRKRYVFVTTVIGVATIAIAAGVLAIGSTDSSPTGQELQLPSMAYIGGGWICVKAEDLVRLLRAERGGDSRTVGALLAGRACSQSEAGLRLRVLRVREDDGIAYVQRLGHSVGLWTPLVNLHFE